MSEFLHGFDGHLIPFEWQVSVWVEGHTSCIRFPDAHTAPWVGGVPFITLYHVCIIHSGLIRQIFSPEHQRDARLCQKLVYSPIKGTKCPLFFLLLLLLFSVTLLGRSPICDWKAVYHSRALHVVWRSASLSPAENSPTLTQPTWHRCTFPSKTPPHAVWN